MFRRRDLMVIGGGAGGLVVASVAARLGVRVTLVDKGPKLGGDCLHSGCVPSKTLIDAAAAAHRIRAAGGLGLHVGDLQVDMAGVNARIRSVVERIQEHDDPERLRGYGCEVLFGTARFTSPHEVEVNGQRIRARRFVIATGSRPRIPDIEGLREAGYLTNEDMFTLPALPARLAVLGAGPVGLELGQAMARLGSAVSVLEQGPQVLPREDPELSAQLVECLEAEGLNVMTGMRVQRVRRAGDVRVLECADGRRVEVDAVLVAVGRRPNVEDLGLETAGVAYGAGGIQVDRRMRTGERHIYAVGDVCGPYAFTHVAEYQAGIVLSNAVFRWPRRADYRVIPRVTYTDPELAHVGLTEQQARERGTGVAVYRFPFSSVDRALTRNQGYGQVKLVARRGRLVGASVLGPAAGELIHELVLAMQARIKISAIAGAVHAYPTLSQIHRLAINAGYAERLFRPWLRAVVRCMNRVLP
ncbi:MAG: FAD-dependent oxidoreductase [Gammaproteobacteria bacterium]